MANTKITSHVIEANAILSTHISSGAISSGHLSNITSAHVAEGSNLYYTNARARGAISVTGGNLAYDASTGVIQLTDSEIRDALSAGTGVTYSSGEFSIGQAVGTSDTVSFGNITTAGYLRGPANFTIDPAGYGDNSGTLIIAGNLQVDGTQTTINSTTLTVDDKNIVLASGAANSAAANGAGITVDGASATLLYVSSGDKFAFNKPLDVTGTITSSSGLTVNNGHVNIDSGLSYQWGDSHERIEQSDQKIEFFTNNGQQMTLFGGNLGIGTDVPKRPLQIGATNQFPISFNGNYPDIHFNTYYEGGWKIHSAGFGAKTTFNGATGAFVYSNVASSQNAAAGFTPVDRFAVLANGNVGIGTSSPLGPLSVGAGSINDASLPVQISTGADGTQAYYGVNRNGAYGALFGYSASSTYKGLIIRNVVSSGTANADGISFMTNNSSMRMHITGAGNVGVGTSSPTSKLEVSVTQSNTMTDDTAAFAIKGNGGDGLLMGVRSSAPYAAWIAAGYLPNIGTSHNYPIALQPHGGNVGIGTAAPYYSLDIYGANAQNGSAKNLALIFDTTSATTGTGGGLAFGGYSNGTSAEINHYGNIQGIKENSTAGNYASAMIFSTRANGATPLERMRIDSNGTLGIKTTPKTWTIDGLQLGTNAALSEDANSIYLSANAYMNSGWKRTNNQLAGYLRMGTNDGIMSFSNAVTGSADSAISWVERFRVHGNGNVGIGTTAPLAKLDTHLTQTSGTLTTSNYAHFGSQVHTNGGIMGITLGYREPNLNYRKVALVAEGLGDNAARQDFHILVNTVDSASSVQKSDSKLMIDGINGNVGIGTTTPNTLLHLNKASTNSDVDMLKIQMPSWSTSNGKLKSIAWNDGSNNVAAIGAEFDGGKVNLHLHSQYNGGYQATSVKTVTILGNGNVGIGTDAPATKLHVKGGSPRFEHTNGGLVITKTGGGSSTNSDYMSALLRTDNAGYHVTTNNGGFGSVANALALMNHGDIILATAPATGGSANYPSGRVMIKDTGNVGIGTDAPGEKLEVNGVIQIKRAGDHPAMRFVEDTTTRAYMGSGDWAVNGLAAADFGISSVGILALGTNAGAGRLYILANGNVGIGTIAPRATLDIRAGHSSGTDNEAINIGRTDDNYRYNTIVSTNNSTTSNVAFKVHDGGNSTSQTKAFEIYDNRTKQSGVGRVTNAGYVAGNATVQFDVNHTNQSSLHIRCGMQHYGIITSYGAVHEGTYGNGSGGLFSVFVQNHTSATSGGWVVSRIDTDNIRITKTAGNYAGGGYWYIIVEGANLL